MAVYRRVTVEVVLKASNLSANLFGTFVHLLYAVWALSLPSSILKAYTWKSAQVTACKSWLLLTRKEPRNDWIFWRGGLQYSLAHGHYIWRSSTGSCIWLIGVTLKRPMQSFFVFRIVLLSAQGQKFFAYQIYSPSDGHDTSMVLVSGSMYISKFAYMINSSKWS